MIRYHRTNWMGMKLVCEYEYSPAERETRTDPGIPEQLCVIEAINEAGYDVIDMLTEKAQEHLSAHVLADLKAEGSEY